MTPADPEALRVAFAVLDVLQDLGIPYHIGGSYASAIHGVPRQTHDIDLVVDLPPDRARDVATALEGAFYVSEEAVKRAAASGASFNLVHFATGVKVDCFVKGRSAFDAAEFSRCVVARLGGESPRDVFVKSAEDLVLRKLLWFRLGGEASDRQMEDVRGVLAVQGERLDRAYLVRWADELGIRDLLERALATRL